MERQSLRARGAAAGLELAPGLVQHPAADRDHEADLLGERHELLRRDEAALRVRPANERLEPLDAPRRDVHDREVVDAELLVQEGALEVGFQVEEWGARSRMFGSNITERALPSAFARYMAVSASRSRSSGRG